MKFTLFLSSLWLLIASFFAPDPTTVLTGQVTDGTDPLIGATVKVLRGTDFVRGVVTDYNGNYRVALEPGAYNLEFEYTGFNPHRITDVQVLLGQINTQNAILTSAALSEVVIKAYTIPAIESDKISTGQILTSDEIKTSPARDAKSKETGTIGSSSVDGEEVHIKGARTDGTDPYIDGIRVSSGVPAVKDVEEHKTSTKPSPAKRSEKVPGMVKSPELARKKTDSKSPASPSEEKKFDFDMDTDMSATGKIGATLPAQPADDIIIVDGRKKRIVIPFDPETYEEKVILIDVEDSPEGEAAPAEPIADEKAETSMPTQPAPRAGLLTAGEWNDLHNWDRHWVDLLADGETWTYQSMYSFFPHQRYTVLLSNQNEVPVADALAQLKTSDGILLWEARTDNTGKAELWPSLYTTEKETRKLHVEIWVKGKKHEISKLKTASEGFNYLKIKAECLAPKNVDIVWAVDATGSMGDEIEYLKTELLDVIGRAKSYNPELSYRMGTVFYRDQGDEYLTRSSELSTDIAKTVEFIQNQYAGGGGDYPEAVHSALEDAIFKQKWSENAIARICFLVLDASPHQEQEVIASLQKSIREAARLGIRIVPIAASGVQKDTEFLMKFFGIATNGTYVFLTDHSGIGSKHLEPTTDEYKVEPLNDLLVRLITEYTSIQTCEGKSEIRFDPDVSSDPQQQPGPIMQALYYPNPAVDHFTLELPFEVQSVTIYDSEGKAVRKVEKPVVGANRIQIQDLAAGFYTIRILSNGLMQSGKLMVARK